MKSNSTLLIINLLFACLSFNSCSVVCEEGNGKLAQKEINPAKFLTISSHVAADILIEKSVTQKVILKIDENLIDNIEIKVEDNQLKITADECFTATSNFNILIQTPELTGVAIHGSGDIRWKDNFSSREFMVDLNGSGEISGVVNAEKLLVKINGSGDVALKGDSKFQNVEVNGSGDYNSELIRSYSGQAKVNGSGDINLGELKKLKAKIAGSGDIKYKGNPEVSQSISGSGDISRK